MALSLQFVILQNGVPRRLLTVRETKKREIVITPTRNAGTFTGGEGDPFGGESIPYNNYQFTVHTCDDSETINLINYKKQNNGSGPVRRIITNALKCREEFFPVYFYASGNLNSPIYDPHKDVKIGVPLGSFDATLFTHCHLVCLSSKQKEFPRLHPAQFKTLQMDLTNYRLHVISFCILLPRLSWKRGLRHILGEYEQNLNGVPDDKIAGMKINSLNEGELIAMLNKHIETTIDSILPECVDEKNPIPAEQLKARAALFASDKAEEVKAHLEQLWLAA